MPGLHKQDGPDVLLFVPALHNAQGERWFIPRVNKVPDGPYMIPAFDSAEAAWDWFKHNYPGTTQAHAVLAVTLRWPALAKPKKATKPKKKAPRARRTRRTPRR